MNSKVNKYSVGDLSGQKILVIDDVPFNRLLPGLILRPFGAEVFECADVHQACELLEQHWVQLILLDISMPGIDGLESLTVLKAHPAFDRAQFKICAYTAYGAGEKEAELLAIGFDEILHKPVKNQKLIELAMSLY